MLININNYSIRVNSRHKHLNSSYKSMVSATIRYIWKNKYLYMFILPGVIWFLIFCYKPMYGVLIAFKEYDIAKGVFASKWIGLKHFMDFFNDYNFRILMTNTVGISLLKIIFGFPAPIILALLLNEIRNRSFKKAAQTISYLPYFVSWVVVAGLWYDLLSIDDGSVVNTILMNFKIIKEPVFWFGNSKYFWGLAVISDIWKNIGWGSIIYLAALSGIDIELYESAVIDGAKKLQQVRYITLPSIKSTVLVLFIFAVSGILNAGFDQIYVMQNPMVMDSAQIIDTYVINKGIFQGNYSIATAVGLFKSVAGVSLLLFTNYIVKLSGEEGVF